MADYVYAAWGEDIGKIKKVTGRCVFCSYQLTKEYPKDFPDDYKWCCGCLMLAKEMVARPEKIDMEIGYLFKRIYNRMTLVES